MSKNARSSLLLGLLFGSLFLLLQAGWAPSTAAQNGRGAPDHKLIAPQGVLPDGLPGVTLWHDYGAFGLYRVADAAWQGLSAELRAQVWLADEMDRLLLEAAPFDTQREEPDLPAAPAWRAPDGPALHLVQFVGPLKQSWLDAVAATGATPVHYVANNGYLVWADAAARRQLRDLVTQGDFLQYSAPYEPTFKLGPTLRATAVTPSAADALVTVTIQMLRHPDRHASESAIKALARAVRSDWAPLLAYQNLVVTVRSQDVLTIAQLPDVVWVGERFEPELLDEVQGQIMAGRLRADGRTPVGPGYLAWLNARGFSTNPNDYPIVDVTDDGIGNGQLISGDTTLHFLGASANPTRLAYVANCTAAVDGGGPDGHGHINVSIAGGYDARSGAPFRDAEGYQRGLGINPYGRFAGTRVFAPNFDLSGCNNSYQVLLRRTYNNGARISSNSWGCRDCAEIYDDGSQAYDAAVRDADLTAPGNQELTIVFAAGNAGPNGRTISTPSNAKNVITVGASESVRPNWTDGCNVGPSGADSAMDIIGFSSRGPAPGTRFKPDLVAPGTHIQGTASTSPFYNGSGVCDGYFPRNQTVFAASSGTSHSTPAVAGAASLVTYWLENRYDVTEPSPALIKAYLLAHPIYLTGVGANDTLPSNSQGLGMPDLGAAFSDLERVVVEQGEPFNASGETWTLQGAIADPTRPARVVMVYTDQPGAIGTNPRVNDLDLTVQTGGQTYYGNRFSGQWSVPGGPPDGANNVEAVFLPPGAGDAFTITVTAFNIAGDGVPNFGDATDQDFALVCVNCQQEPDFALSSVPATQALCAPDAATYTINVLSILGYSAPVTLAAQNTPPGASVEFSPNPVLPPGASQMTLANLSGLPAGSYETTVAGVGATGTRTTRVGLDLFTAVPLAPAPLTPAQGAGDLPLDVTLTWTAVAQTAGYDLEIATDSGFQNIIESASGLTETQYAPRSLETGRRYFWRVRARNACGDGAQSAVFFFSTASSPGDCAPGIAPQLLYRTDFESGAAGWTHGGENDTWRLVDAIANRDGRAFFARGLNEVSDQYLISPPVALPTGAAPLTLRFWNYQSIESATVGCFDGAILEISTDDGATWAQVLDPTPENPVLLTDSYDGVVSSSYQNPLAGQLAWCGDPQDWLDSIVNLDAYAGETVRFRFRLGTDMSIGREGWAIDDVRVQSCPAAEIALAVEPQTQDVCAPDTAVYNVSVTSPAAGSTSVTLDVTQLPPGATATFSNNPLFTPGSSELTLGNTAAVAPGGYVMEVSGTAVSGSAQAAISLNLFDAAPGAPQLVAPADGALDAPTSVTLRWTTAEDGARYDLEVADDPNFANVVVTATNLEGTSYPVGGLATNVTYFWRVRAQNACGPGAFSPVRRFTTVRGPLDCRPGGVARLLYQTDFETADPAWTHSGLGDTWARRTDRARSGQYAYHAYGVPEVSDQYLVSPPIELPILQAPLGLQYSTYRIIEGSGNTCYDGAILEISEDDGRTWTQLGTGETQNDLLTDPYNGVVSGGFGNPLANRPAWCGSTDDWLDSIVKLDAYGGRTVRFRFRLATDASVDAEGWTLDDVRLQACQYDDMLPRLFFPLAPVNR
jgi:hypothetical protein